MKLKGRTELKARFKNGMRPSQTHFEDLITSMLNQRDDQFLGRWQSGTTYRAGDIVIHKRAFWELTDGDGDGNGDGVREICALHPPGLDNPDWRSLVIPVEDSDWFLVDLSDAGLGSEQQQQTDDDPLATMHANPRVVRVGIGTDAPTAYLDLLDAGRGRLLFNGCKRPGAVLCLVDLDPEQAQHYLAAWVQNSAALVTDAPEGFALHAGQAYPAFCDNTDGEQDPPLMVVKLDGRVGIGTDAPRTHLEVTDNKSGRFSFNLDCKVNPALSIVNQRPGCRENYLVIGADNDVAALVTDSDYGFVFRAGAESGVNDSELDINQGRELLWILPQGRGKVGIGRQPENYQLDVNGVVRGFGFFVDTDERNLCVIKPLAPVLDKVCDLRPVSFEWAESTGLDEPGRKIGLVAHEVEDIFPEVVKTHADRSKALSQDALVPVLVKAIQEQQATIEGLQARLDQFEQRLAALESPPETEL